jgi:hypothetical protein
LTEDQERDLAAANMVADEAHRRWLDALEAADKAELDLTAAIAAHDLKKLQYRLK